MAPGPVMFPCARIPDEPAQARLIGIYPQRQQGLFMQRVRVHMGRISPAQLRTLGEIAHRHSPGYPLHLTTRQDIELHGLTAESLPRAQRQMADAGLTAVGTCGDTLRNVTTCVDSGVCSGGCNVDSLADAVKQAAEALPWIQQLPRKFKISLSGCSKACGRPYINDIGFVVQKDGTFLALAGGSLGARPSTGIEVCARIAADRVVPFALAALRLFHAEGDRENRAKARLRHVRERLGDDEFRRRLTVLFASEPSAGGVAPLMPPSSSSMRRLIEFAPPLGDLTFEDTKCIAGMAEGVSGELRIGFAHEIVLIGPIPKHLCPLSSTMRPALRIVACPGTTWCSRGVADSRAAAGSIRTALEEVEQPLLRGLTICLSGCPNNCAHSAVADIGLVGRIATIEGNRQECFRVFAGGGNGVTSRLAKEVESAVPLDRVAQTVLALATNQSWREGDK
jgi:sulfite reductase (ferredoxin)